MSARQIITTTALAVTGIGLWAHFGGELAGQDAFESKPNPLGLKDSPYGQVIAMAIQGPVDQDFHVVMSGPKESGFATRFGDSAEDSAGPRDSSRAPEPGHTASHDHTCSDTSCTHEHHTGHPAHGDTAPSTLIGKLTAISGERTNPNPPTAGHKLYLRSKIENKLRFAYELDPTHYGNYNSYHLFLTEPELGTNTTKETYYEGRDRADELSRATIRACLDRPHDPRPALTAATAAYNILESMFLQPEEHTSEDMRGQIRVIRYCYDRFERLLEDSMEDGTWSLLSDARHAEIIQRASFTRKMIETAEKTLERLAGQRATTVSHGKS